MTTYKVCKSCGIWYEVKEDTEMWNLSNIPVIDYLVEYGVCNRCRTRDKKKKVCVQRPKHLSNVANVES